jgi:hypothetical protein
VIVKCLLYMRICFFCFFVACFCFFVLFLLVLVLCVLLCDGTFTHALPHHACATQLAAAKLEVAKKAAEMIRAKVQGSK